MFLSSQHKLELVLGGIWGWLPLLLLICGWVKTLCSEMPVGGHSSLPTPWWGCLPTQLRRRGCGTEVQHCEGLLPPALQGNGSAVQAAPSPAGHILSLRPVLLPVQLPGGHLDTNLCNSQLLGATAEWGHHPFGTPLQSSCALVQQPRVRHLRTKHLPPVVGTAKPSWQASSPPASHHLLPTRASGWRGPGGADLH